MATRRVVADVLLYSPKEQFGLGPDMSLSVVHSIIKNLPRIPRAWNFSFTESHLRRLNSVYGTSSRRRKIQHLHRFFLYSQPRLLCESAKPSLQTQYTIEAQFETESLHDFGFARNRALRFLRRSFQL